MSDQAPRDSIGSDAGQAAADSICTGFTRGWMTGQRPGIVDVLAEVEAEARPALLRRLLPLELEFRRATGEEPKAADYSEHLGEFADVIVEFFEKSVPTAGVSTAEDTETIVRSPRPSPSLPPDSPLAEESTSDRHGDATPQPPDRDAPDSEQLGAVELSPGETDQTIVESAAVTPDSNAKSFETDLDLSPVAKADPARTLLEDGETINVRPQTTSASDSEFGYDQIQEIARGGMGVVFKARQKKLKRIVALKMILFGQLASQEEIRRFYVEAEAAAALDHPNIVPIYEVGEHNGQHFFSMGFIEGTSLTAWAQMKKPSPVDAALVIKTVAEAVHYAHQHGIIHRDLKPANILMDGDRPHVTDFGLARNLEGDSAMTTTGQIMGTPSYMPPEQARGDLEAIGPASDVYSLGVILYELLVGRPPFKASRVLETLELVQHAEPTPPRSLNRSVDRDLDTIVLKCLRKDTSERYASAQELADEIERYRNGEPILARRIGPVARAWRWCRRKPILTGLVAAVLLVAVSLTVVFSLGRQVRDARAVATIRDELALRLAQPQLDVEWLASFDQPLAKAAALDTKAAGDFRSSVHSSYVTHIRAKLREARLSADDYSKIEKALSGLATRDGDVTGLRELLEQRKSDWQLLVEFAAPWESMPEVNQPLRQTDAALVLVGDDKQIPVVTRSVPLVSIDSGNRVRIEARFDDAWRNSARIGLTLLLRGQQGYGFQLRVPDSIESAGEDEPPSPKQPAQPDTTATDESLSFATAARAGQPLLLEMMRNGSPLHANQVSASSLTGPLLLRVVRDRDRLTFQLNDLPALEFRDVFPLTTRGQVVCRLDWPEEVGLVRFVASVKSDPEAQSPLEQGDQFFDQADYSAAFTAYEQQAVNANSDTTRQEALTKAGFCLSRLKRDAEAEEFLSRVFLASGDLWPALAGCQLWAMALSQDRRADGDAIFDTISARFRFDQIARVIPHETRELILKAYFSDLNSFSRIIRHDPRRIARFERAAVIDRLLSPDGRGGFTHQMQLSRAYRFAGEFTRAAENLADLWQRFPDSADIARNYSRVLRMTGDFDTASEVIEQARKRAAMPAHHRTSLLLERAKIHAARKDWVKAERDVDQILGESLEMERNGATEDGRIHMEASTWLMKGFLQRRRGEAVAAVNSWRRGFTRCRSLIQKYPPEFATVFHAIMMGGLTGELSQAEAMLFVTRSTTGQGGQSPVGALGAVLGPETIRRVCLEMWWSDRGLELAEKTAFEQSTMMERIRMPLQLAGATILRLNGFGGTISVEQEDMIWRTMESLFDEIVLNGRVKATQIAQLGLAWKGVTNFIGWGGVAPQLEPEMRAQLAWLMAYRALLKGNSSQAVTYFETVIRDTKDTSLRQLAEADLAQVNAGTGRVEFRNDTDQPVRIKLLADGQASVDVELPKRGVITQSLPSTTWQASLTGPADRVRLSAATFKVSPGSYALSTVQNLWAPGDSQAALPGVIPRPSDTLGTGRWQVTVRDPAATSGLAAFNPDGTLVAVAEIDGLVRIRDSQTAEVLKILPGHFGRCRTVCWSGDGTLLVSASEDATLRLWSMPDGRFLRRILLPAGVVDAGFSPAADEIATVTWDNVLRLWSVDGLLLFESKPLGRAIAVAWSNDGQWLATNGAGGSLRLYPRNSNGFGNPQQINLTSARPRVIAWNSKGDAIAVADEFRKLQIIRRQGGQWKALPPVPAHDATVLMVAWDDDDVWTGGLDGHLKKWSTDGSIEMIEQQWRRGTCAVSRSPSGRFAFSDSGAGFSLSDFGGEALSSGRSTRRLMSIARNPSGTRYAVAMRPPGDVIDAGEVHVLTDDGEPVARFPSRDSVAFLDDETLVAAGHGNSVVRFRIGSDSVETIAETEQPITVVAVARDGKIAIAGRGAKIRVLNPDGSLARELPARQTRVEQLAWSANGWLAAGYDDARGQLWDAAGNPCWPDGIYGTREPTGLVVDQQQPLRYLAWHSRANVLVGATGGPGLSFWSDGKPTEGPIQSRLYVAGLAWNPDGTRLAVAATQGRLQLFTQDGELINDPQQTTAQFRSLVWSPDGSKISLADENAVIRRFRVESTQRPNTALAGLQVEAESIEVLPDLTTLLLPNGGTVTFSVGGQVMSASPEFEAAMVYLVEADDGSFDMLTPQEFRRRAGDTED